jgi:hypothetical protein
MKVFVGTALVSVLTVGATANAAMTLQFDVNGIAVQAQNSAGTNSSFGGLSHTLSHTGSVNFNFSSGITRLVDIAVANGNGVPQSQGFTGSLVDFDGHINMVNGQVTGGNIQITVNGGDTYSASITPNVGAVSNFVGGGYKIEGLTFNGMFSDAMFGNVNVSEWFNSQGLTGLLGSFLQFNFNPNAAGASYADMDIFVNAQVIPLPPAAWTGVATLSGLMVAGYIRRRR